MWGCAREGLTGWHSLWFFLYIYIYVCLFFCWFLTRVGVFLFFWLVFGWFWWLAGSWLLPHGWPPTVKSGANLDCSEAQAWAGSAPARSQDSRTSQPSKPIWKSLTWLIRAVTSMGAFYYIRMRNLNTRQNVWGWHIWHSLETNTFCRWAHWLNVAWRLIKSPTRKVKNNKMAKTR